MRGPRADSPVRIAVDQFSSWKGPNANLRAGASLSQVGLLVGSAAAGFVGFKNNLDLYGLAPFLTATSIITGLTFTMAMRFWERSLDSRRDPEMLLRPRLKNLQHDMLTHLLWTVLVGVMSTAWISGCALFQRSSLSIGSAATAVAVSLFLYQLLLVVASLVKLYRASYELR